MDFATSQQNSNSMLLETPEERRTDIRMKRKFLTQMTPWSPGHASVPFDVLIEEISGNRAVLVHERELEAGLRHLLTVPRENGSPLVSEYTVAKCTRRRDGQYLIYLNLSGTADQSPSTKPEKKNHVKLLILSIALIGLMIALFAPI